MYDPFVRVSALSVRPICSQLIFRLIRGSLKIWEESMLLVLRKAPRLSAPHVDGWQW
jgi:hypothetical protein